MPLESIPTVGETGKHTRSERLREGVLPLWQRQLEHPFVVALGNGSLPRANFEFYIRQDALFLDELTKTFAYAATRTSYGCTSAGRVSEALHYTTYCYRGHHR